MNATKTLAPHASHIADILMDRHIHEGSSSGYVTEDALMEATGLPGYAVRWYIFHLRQAGFIVEAAQYADPEMFANGTRGWKLTDIQSEPYNPRGQKDVEDMADPVDLMRDVAALALLVGRARRRRYR